MKSASAIRAMTRRTGWLATCCCLAIATNPVFAAEYGTEVQGTTAASRMDAARTGTAADEALRTQILGALLASPEIYAKHIDVTVENGAVTIDGMVFDGSDLRAAIRVVYGIDGALRVIDQLEIYTNDFTDLGAR